MKIRVDRVLCEGNARCVKTAPRVFRTDDQDQLEILMEQIPDEERDAVETAVAICPRQALSIQES